MPRRTQMTYLQEACLPAVERLEHKVVVVRHVEDGPGGPRVAQLEEGAGAERLQEVLRPDAEQVAEVAERHRGPRAELEVGEAVGGRHGTALPATHNQSCQ